jgi:hypothetical protein
LLGIKDMMTPSQKRHGSVLLFCLLALGGGMVHGRDAMDRRLSWRGTVSGALSGAAADSSAVRREELIAREDVKRITGGGSSNAGFSETEGSMLLMAIASGIVILVVLTRRVG